MMDTIAIIGIGCRFPGSIHDTESFWQLLEAGRDAIGPMPQNRFDRAHYLQVLRAANAAVEGGFLENIDQFDAHAFGISDHEVQFIDPQQRLLLEVAWEALEDAGQVPEYLAGHPVGVFMGLWTNEYEDKMFAGVEDIDLYVTTGSGRYAASNRISHHFDFRGPSLTVDTACSSSLVALHLACQSLLNREVHLALAGGANLILNPEISLGYARSGMLSADARCKFGDASADGYVRSEGAGVVILKRLDEALRDGDPIDAIIHATGVNNGGGSGRTFVAPSVEAQMALLRAVYAQAGIDPAQVGYVEAHGTGTVVGDTVELEALGRVLSENRPDDSPCWIGSVKTNFGHSEAASGIAGLIKVVLCLQHRAIPPSLHLRQPNPRLPWTDLVIRIPQEMTVWPNGPAFAGVNSFGITGTNAHVVLEAAPAPASRQPTEDQSAYLIPLSAHTEAALTTQSERYQALPDPIQLRDLAYTTSTRRAHHAYRLALLAHTTQDLREGLQHAVPHHSAAPPRLAFVFAGQGPRWRSTGKRLLALEPVFRASVEACDARLREYADWSILDLMNDEAAAPRLENAAFAQPVQLAIQIGLAALWRAWGIEPQVVLGHSMGEIAAAYVGGALSLPDAMRIAVHRGRLTQQAAGSGRMLAAEVSLDQAERLLKQSVGPLYIAAINSPRSIIFSGDQAAIDTLATSLDGVYHRQLSVEYASHSPLMQDSAHALQDALVDIAPQPLALPMLSTVTGEKIQGEALDAAYWARNLRQPVLFARTIAALAEDGIQTFLEISPQAMLTSAIEQNLSQGSVLASLHRDTDDLDAMYRTLGRLYEQGHPVDWQAVYPERGTCLRLPGLPWQRQHYWFEGRTQRLSYDAEQHPLLGLALPEMAHLPDQRCWERIIDDDFLTATGGTIGEALPEPVWNTLMAAAAETLFDGGIWTIVDQDRPAPLMASWGSRIQTVISRSDAQQVHVRVFSRAASATTWTLHRSVTLVLTAARRDWFYRLDWQAAPLERAAAAPGTWLIVGGTSSLGPQVAQALTQRGGQARIMPPDQTLDLERLLRDASEPLQGILYLGDGPDFAGRGAGAGNGRGTSAASAGRDATSPSAAAVADYTGRTGSIPGTLTRSRRRLHFGDWGAWLPKSTLNSGAA